jgi:hypothetical protein
MTARLLFRATILAFAAATASAAYFLTARQEVYVLAIMFGYGAAHLVVAKTVYGWIDQLYWATVGKEDGEERAAKAARKAARITLPHI